MFVCVWVNIYRKFFLFFVVLVGYLVYVYKMVKYIIIMIIFNGIESLIWCVFNILKVCV